MANDVIKWKTGLEHWLWLFKQFLWRENKMYLQKMIPFSVSHKIAMFVAFIFTKQRLNKKQIIYKLYCFLHVKRCWNRQFKQKESVHRCIEITWNLEFEIPSIFKWSSLKYLQICTHFYNSKPLPIMRQSVLLITVIM